MPQVVDAGSRRQRSVRQKPLKGMVDTIRAQIVSGVVGEDPRSRGFPGRPGLDPGIVLQFPMIGHDTHEPFGAVDGAIRMIGFAVLVDTRPPFHLHGLSPNAQFFRVPQHIIPLQPHSFPSTHSGKYQNIPQGSQGMRIGHRLKHPRLVGR